MRGSMKGSMRSMRGTDSGKGVDAVEAILIKRGIRQNRGTQLAYTKKLKNEFSSMRLSAGAAIDEINSEINE